MWVYSLGYQIVPYFLSFCVTAPKRLHLLNSNLLTTIPHKPLNGLSWNFVLLKFLLPKNVWVSFFYLCMASEYGEGFISHAQTYMHKIHLTLWCYTQKKTGEFKNGAVWCYPYSCQILYFVQIYIKIMIIFSINEFSEKPNHKF